MDVRIMEYMQMIEQEKSLSQAAQKLNISQPALSQALSKLEKSFKSPLFVRSNRQMTPTRIGQIYLDGAREMLQVKEDTYRAIEALAKKDSKHIKITADSQAILRLEKELIPALKKRFPKEEFSLVPADSRMAKEYLMNHIADAAFLGSRLRSNSMLNYHHLYSESLVLCIPENLNKAYEELAETPSNGKIPFILPQEGLYFRLLCESILQKLSLSISKTYDVEDFLTMKRLMEQGFGAALLPSRMAREAKNCHTCSVPEEFSYGFYFAVPKYHEDELEFDYILKKAKEIFDGEGEAKS